jgi:uncharacterized repeat protein (TIGR01451 family)
LTYSLTVVNAGPNPAAGVTLTDPLPGNLTFSAISQTSGPSFLCNSLAVGAGGTIGCSLASMAVGTATFSLTVKVPAGTPSGTPYTNTATVATSTFDPDTTNNSSSSSTTVSNADVSVTKTGASRATVGSSITYTITAQNNGPDTAQAVLLADVLPAATRFASLTQSSGPTATCSTPAAGSGGTVTCNLPMLTSGQSAVFLLAVTVASGGLTISNTATVSAYSADPNSANNSSTVNTVVPAVSIPTLNGFGLWLLGLSILGAGWVSLCRGPAVSKG